MDGDCAACESLWEEYGRLAELRLALSREQRTGGRGPLQMPLGQRIQMLAEAQIRVRKRLAAHEAASHQPRLSAQAPPGAFTPAQPPPSAL
jgi:hypothetical protein